jgi:hypothetical protein
MCVLEFLEKESRRSLESASDRIALRENTSGHLVMIE